MGFSVDVPTVEEETEAPEEADNNDPFSSNVFDCVSVEEVVSFDDNTTSKQTSVEDWVEEIFWAARSDVQEDVTDSDL